MRRPDFWRAMLVGVMMGLVGGCQTASAPVPAVLSLGQPGDLDEVRRVAGLLLGRTRIELGAGDLRTQSVVSVLPPPPGPYETHSLARPDQLNLVLMGEGCYLVQPETGSSQRLVGVRCRRLD